MRAMDNDSTQLTWSLAVDSSGPPAVVRALYSLVNRVLIGVAARRLATFVGADSKRRQARTNTEFELPPARRIEVRQLRSTWVSQPAPMTSAVSDSRVEVGNGDYTGVIAVVAAAGATNGGFYDNVIA
jgi:hypothetical protein